MESSGRQVGQGERCVLVLVLVPVCLILGTCSSHAGWLHRPSVGVAGGERDFSHAAGASNRANTADVRVTLSQFKGYIALFSCFQAIGIVTFDC